MSTQTTGRNSRRRDEFIAEEAYGFVREFQAIKIRVTPEDSEKRVYVFVHPPYMLQSVTLLDNEDMVNRLKERHRSRLQRVREARDTAPETAKKFLTRQFYEQDRRERHIASGRAGLVEIRELLQEAVDEGLVSASQGRTYPDSYVLRQWLKKYGVGIDCSAFVQQALKRLVKASRIELGKVSETGSRLEKSFLRCRTVYRDITEGDKGGERTFMHVVTPAEARPGDVVASQSHMRIVAGTETVEGEGVILEAAESASAIDKPVGQAREEADIGPRIIQVRYPKPNQPIAEQSPLKKRLVDNAFERAGAESLYVIGRSWEIEKLWRGT